MLNTTQEIWTPILEADSLYEISSHGRIRNLRQLVMKTYVINSGYLAIKLVKQDGKRLHRLIHRLVLQEFTNSESKKTEVNHKDGNKHNNCLENLEWVTSSENKIHARDTGLKIYNIPTLGIKLSNVSRFHNVGFDSIRNKWRAGVRHEGKTYYQKRFDSEIDAALHVNWILDKLNLVDRPRNIV